MRDAFLDGFFMGYLKALCVYLFLIGAWQLAEYDAERECVSWCRASGFDWGVWRPKRPCRCIFPHDTRSWAEVQADATRKLVDAVHRGEVQP